MAKELEYIKQARKAASGYVNDLLTLDRNAGYISDEDFKIENCVWSAKDWSVVFSSEKIPGDRVFLDYDYSHDEILIEVVGSEEEAAASQQFMKTGTSR